jgi:hypothetical protein
MHSQQEEKLMSSKTERLSDIKMEMLELLNEAKRLVRGTDEENRAKSYWIAHIRCTLDDDHSYLGGSMVTMQESIDTLEGARRD